DAAEIKLHSKVMVIGGNRVFSGSANFSAAGFKGNIETGRLVTSDALAKAVTTRFMDIVWEKGSTLKGVETVPFEKRVPLTAPPKLDTPIEDVVFLVFDFETTGFVPSHDERILSLSFEARRYKRDGSYEIIDELNEYVDPGTDAFGRPFEIPKRAVEVHGLDRETLEKLGAKPVREVAPKVVAMLQRLAEEGPVVPTGQNTAFDLRFFDFLLSRPELGAEVDGETVHYRMQPPFIDTAQVSAKIFPDSFAHDLDAIMKRLGIKPRKDLPRHDARADVVYTGDALGKLVERGKLAEFGELLGPDRIEINEPMPLWADPKGGDSGVRFDLNESGTLLAVLEDEKGSPTRNVQRLEVGEVKGTSVEVNATIRWKGEDRILNGWIDGNRISFKLPGCVYEKLRDAGVDVGVPGVLT
ncbi:MAG: exonuclease domain-containing protein, partial [Myxococcota bacterium]